MLMDASLRNLVRQRAGNRCEYCRIHQDDDPFLTFHVEHIIARQHGGPDIASNLALSCNHCNSCKGPNLSGIDSRTGKVVRLFHPRRHKWERHFRWKGAVVLGRTPLGRATVAVLQINNPDRLALRRILLDAGVFPP
jgi:hypothetical protein